MKSNRFAARSAFAAPAILRLTNRFFRSMNGGDSPFRRMPKRNRLVAGQGTNERNKGTKTMRLNRLSVRRALAGIAFASLFAPLAPLSAIAQGSLPTVSLSPTSVEENAGMATFTATLSEMATSDVMVDYATSDDTAVVDEDYKAASGTLTFAMGEIEKMFTVEIIDDRLDEEDESFDIVFSSSDSTAQGSTHAVTITGDNDNPPGVSLVERNVTEDVGEATFTARLNSASGRVVTVDYATADVGITFGNPATVGEDYEAATGTLTFAAGEREKTFKIKILDDALDEDDEKFNVELSSPDMTIAREIFYSVTITGDNDDPPTMSLEIDGAAKDSDGAVVVEEDDGTVALTAILDKASGRTTVVRYFVTAGNTTPSATSIPSTGGLADVGEDLAEKNGFLVFDKGDSRKTITINITDDALDENDEYFRITFFSYPNSGQHLMTSSPLVKITGDNDDPPIVTIDRSVVFENQLTWDFTAKLDRPSGRLSRFTIRTVGGTAAAGEDFRSITRAIDIPKGVTERGFQIHPLLIHDVLDEDDETFRFAMTSEAGTLQVAEHELTIIDDDGPPALTLTPDSVQEGDGQVTFTATLASSGRDVTVDYATEDRTAVAGEDYFANEGTLSFAKGDTEATFAVNIVDDALDEIDEAFALAFDSPDGTAQKSTHEVMITMDNDSAPTAEFEIASSGVNEAGKVTVAATLSAASGSDATLTYRTADGTATTAGSDYTAVSSGTLVIPAGETRGTFDITTLTDTAAEGDETFKVELVSAVGATLGARKEHTVTIHDDDGTLPSITLTPPAVPEGVGMATFTATLNGGTEGTVYSVGYATVDGTAVAGEDYVSDSGSLNFTRSRVLTFDIAVTQDMLDEIVGETFAIALTSSDGAVQESVHVVEIQDDDAAPTLTLSPGEVLEDDGTVIFTATLSEASGRTATVAYATSDGMADDPATAGEDYVTAMGTLTFAKGDTVERFAVDITDDLLDENDETFDIAFTSSDLTVQNSTHAVTITGDNDNPPYLTAGGTTIFDENPPSHIKNEVTVSLSDARGVDFVPSGRDVTFQYATRDHIAPHVPHATAGEDYVAASGTLTIPKGEIGIDLEFDITDDDLFEEDEIFILSLSSLDGTAIGENTNVFIISDDDALPTVSLDKTTVAEADGTVTLTATLDGTVDGNVTVEWATADGTAAAGEDYTANTGTLNFTSTAKSQTFDIVVTQDMLDEADETFSISFSSMDGTAQAATVEMTITDDDDTPTAAFVFPTNDDNVAENVATGQDFTVKLVDGTGADLANGSGKDITIQYALVDGTAVHGEDYSGEKTGTVTIPKGMSSATVASAFSFIDDNVHEGDETFTVRFTNTDGNVALPTSNEVAVKITENESVPTAQFATATSSVAEGASTAIVVTLSGPSSRFITLEYFTDDGTAGGSDYESAHSGISFVPGETVQILGPFNTTADNLDEEDETFKVEIVAGFMTTVGIGMREHTVTILDDDGTEPTVSLTPSRVSEDGGTATFTATLSETVTTDMTLEYRTADRTALAGQDYVSKTGTLEFTAASPNPKLTVEITDDSLDEIEEYFSIILESPDDSIQSTTHEVDIEDDDPQFEINLSPTRVTEQNGAVTFTMTTESNGRLSRVGGRWDAMGGTATINEDYAGGGNVIGFNAGATRTFQITFFDDLRREGDETFNIVFRDFDGNVLSTHVVTIDDDEDDVLPTVTLTPASVDESAGMATFKASLDGDFDGTVTVEYETSDGTAVADEDYVSRTGSLTFTAAAPNPTFAVPITDDVLDEGDETFDIEFSSANGTAQASTHTVTISGDNDDPPSVSLDMPVVQEEGGTVTFTATLNEASGQDVTLGYRTTSIGETATTFADYVPATGTLTIAKGETTGSFEVAITNDSLEEGDETFRIELASADGTVRPSEHVVTIDDDETLPVVMLTPSEVDESAGTATFTASLRETPAADVTVEWETENGTGAAGAVAGDDFVSNSGSLTINAASPNPTFTIDITQDSLDESDEIFDIELSSSDGTAKATTHAVTITDDDDLPAVSLDVDSVDENSGAVTFTATLSSASGRAAKVAYATADDTAEAGEDFEAKSGVLTFAKGETTKTFSIAIIDDALDENDESFDIALTSPDGTAEALTHSVTIGNDNDEPPNAQVDKIFTMEDERTEMFNLVLSSASGREAKATYATSDVDAVAGLDYRASSGTVTFAKGETTKIIPVEIIDDALDEATESFNITLSSPDSTLEICYQCADRFTSYVHAVGILDNDDPPAVTLSPTKVGEDDGAVTFTAELASSGREVTVEYATADGTAMAGDDYTTASGTLTFPKGETTQTFEVTLVDDAVSESDETFDIALTSSDSTAEDLTQAITVFDDDFAPVVVGSFLDDTPKSESQGAFNLFLQLNDDMSQPVAGGVGRDIVVDYELVDGTAVHGEDYVGPKTGTVTIEKFNQFQVFRSLFLIVDDGVHEGDETFKIKLTISAGNATAEKAEYVVTIMDDDDPPSVTLSPLRVPEADATVTFTATLDEASGRATTIEYATSGGTATEGTDYDAASGTLNIAKGGRTATFDVAIKDDTATENDENFSVAFTSMNDSAADSTHTVTIDDDEDDTLPRVVFDKSSVNENDGTVTFTASLSKTITSDVTAQYATSNGTAQAGEDYESKNGTLTFTSAAPTQTLTITVTDDALDENDETFGIAITSGDNTAEGSTHTVTITGDNDDPPTISISPTMVAENDVDTATASARNVTFTATLSEASGRVAKTVYWTANGTAVAGTPADEREYGAESGTLTFAKGDTEATFDIRIDDDTLLDGDKTFQVVFASSDDTIQDSTHDVTIQDNERPPLPTVSLTPASVDENQGTVTFTASIDRTVESDVTVEWTTDDGTAAAGEDYVANSGTLQFTSASANPTLTVEILDDALDEGDETFDIDFTSNDGTALGSTHTVTITGDNDDPPSITLSPASVGEGDGTVTFTATLSEASGREAKTTYTTSGGTATEGTDYEAATGALTFAKGETEKTFTVVITEDSLDEAAETFDIGLASADDTVQSLTHEVTIADNDNPPQVSISPLAVDENVGMATFTATLGAASGRAVNIEYATSDDTAAAGEDYQSVTGTLAFAVGETTKTFTIEIVNDNLDEDAETFDIELTSMDGTAAASTHEVTINDNDNAPTVSVEIPGEPKRNGAAIVEEEDGTVTLTAVMSPASGRRTVVGYRLRAGNTTPPQTGLPGDVADVGEDVMEASGSLTFEKGESRKTFDIVIVDDALDENDELFQVEFLGMSDAAHIGTSIAWVNITRDNDDPPSITLSPDRVGEADGNVTFTATLSEASGREAKVLYATGSGTATEGTDFETAQGELTFAKGDTAETFMIEITDDTLSEGAETFDVAFNSSNQTIQNSTHDVTINDDEIPSVTLSPSSVNENAGTVTFTASLSGTASGDVTVEWTTDDDTAVAGEDYVTNSGTLVLNSANPNPTLTVEIIDDALDEEDETFDIEITSANGTSAESTHAVTITGDNDAPPSVELSPTSVDEGDGTVTFTATLSSSGREATVEYATSGGTATEGTDYDAASGTLTFAKGDTTETFTIDITNDSLSEGSENFQVAFTSSNRTARASTHDVTIIDDEVPSVALSPARVNENVGTATFAASLSGSAAGDVNVEWRTEDGTAAAGQDYDSRSGSLTINSANPNPTIAVPIRNDSLHEDEETFDIVLSSRDGTAGSSTHTVTIAVDSNDDPPRISISPTEVREDDGFVTFTARLASNGKETTVVQLTHDAEAVNGEDYRLSTDTLTFAKGDVEETFTVEILDDALDENDEFFEIYLIGDDITPRNPSPQAPTQSVHEVTITGDNDDPPSVSLSPTTVDEDAGRVTFTAALSEASGRTVTVAYATSNGTANAGTDYSRATGTLTFAAGDTRETFAIDMIDNAQEDGDKTFRVALSSPNGTAQASTRAVTIEDDESLPRVRLTPASANEGDGAVTFTASLAGRVSGDVTVEWETENGTATAGEDYEAKTGSLTFTAASPNPTLSIMITDDSLDENEESFEINFASANGTARPSSHEVTIADDDALPTLGLTVDRTSVDEGGKVVATATLTPASGRQVGVDAVVEDGTTTAGDYEVSGLTGGRLTFARGDASETFDIDIVDDPLNELAETFTVRLSAPDGAALGSQVSRTVTIASDGSDPEPTVAFSEAATSVREGEGRLDVEARLSAESGRRVTVDYATADATGGNAAVAGEDYAAASGTLTFEAGDTAESFRVEVEADGEEEEAEIFDIALSSPVGASLGRPSGMRVTILDGDDPILRPVVNYLAARAEALLAQQPRLSGILRGETSSDSTPGFSLSASDDGTRAKGGFSAGTVWGSANGIWSSRDDAERRHVLGTIGAHAEVSEDLMLGGMLQFDSVAGELEGGTGEIRGKGWMAGPYIAARGASGRLRFEGRLLYGQSSNEIEGFSTGAGRPLRDGTFDSERWLALASVEGEYRLRNGTLVLPSADLGHSRLVAEGFTDSLGRQVEGQIAALTQLQFGATFEIPVDATRGDLTFRPGLRLVATDEDGGEYGVSELEAGGRIDIGFDYKLDGRLSLEFDSFYSGLGQKDRESYGAGLGLRLDF